VPLPTHVAREIARLMRDPDALRHERERMPPSGRRGRYDPNQPRVSAGNSDGGQWTDTGGSAGASAYQRPQIDHTVLGGASLADIAAGRAPIEHVQARTNQRRFPNPIDFADAVRLGLYNEWSVRNGPNQQAIVEFRAAQYRRDTLDIAQVAVLSRSELGNRCPLLEKVQSLTDEAAAEVKGNGITLSPQQSGTAIHTLLRHKIIEFNHPNLKAEVSFLKGEEEDYGVKGTVRIDGLERVNYDTVCIHDIKTGKAPLSFSRMLEMVVNSQKMYGSQIKHFIVTEVRPTP
jgi:hypothetical protein